MSHRRHVLGSLDTWARNSVEPQIDPDTADLDRAFWQIAIQLSKSHPETAKTAFSLTTELITALSALDDCPPALSNGIVLSFAPVFSAEDFAQACSNAQQAFSSALLNGHRHIDVMYWQTLVRVAERRGASLAAIVFGIPTAIAEQAAVLGFSGARHLGQNFNVSWALRCRSELVLQSIGGLSAAEPTASVAAGLMARLAQSLATPTLSRIK